MTPRIFEAFERDEGDSLFDPAPRAVAQRLCADLAARFGSVDLPLLRRIAAAESAAALQLMQASAVPAHDRGPP